MCTDYAVVQKSSCSYVHNVIPRNPIPSFTTIQCVVLLISNYNYYCRTCSVFTRTNYVHILTYFLAFYRSGKHAARWKVHCRWIGFGRVARQIGYVAAEFGDRQDGRVRQVGKTGHASPGRLCRERCRFDYEFQARWHTSIKWVMWYSLL